MNSKIRDALGVVLILSLLAVSVGVIGYVKTYSRVSEPTSFRSFSVNATGKAVAVPDVAKFTFSVITEGGKDVADLQKKNTEKTNATISYLKEQGLDAKDIRTSGYNIYPRYQYYPCNGVGPCKAPDITGYSVSQSVEVKVRDFSKAGTVLSGVVSKGANSVSDLNFTTDDPTAVQDEARAEAIQKAKVKAESIAKAGGFRIGRLLSIDESNGGNTPQPYAYGMGGGVGGGGADKVAAAPTIEPGTQDVNVTVNLQYEIK
ncbi:MAG: SIMPL domain-containing protein [Patescibacteria group bacterium]|jgi:hypothetical protein